MRCSYCDVGVRLTDAPCPECGRPLDRQPRLAVRPFGLTLLAPYSGFSGALTLLMTLPIFLLASVADLPVFHPFETVALPVLSLVLPLIGLLNLALAVGLWTRQRWAHPLAVGLFIVGPSLSLFFLLPDPHGSLQTLMTVGECLIATSALVYLFSPRTRAHFGTPE